MQRSVSCLLILLAGLPGLLAGSTQDELRKRQAELETLRDQIREYGERIEEQQRTEHATLDLLDAYDKKGTLLRRLIGKLRKQEEELQRKIETTRANLERLQSQLDFLKQHYANYVASVYKSGITHDLELLLSSRSINQFLVRNEYLKRFSTQRRADVQKIKRKTREVEEVHARAQQELTDERRLLAEKGAEEDRLASLVEDRTKVLGSVRSDRKLLERAVDRKMRAARELEGIIARLIEAEQMKEERAEEEARNAGVQPPTPPMGAFESMRGNLRWPVTDGVVVARFGNQRHPTLRTVTQNTGIDIAVKLGSPVVAVADAEVSRIWWLPSYGNLVILNHYGGYRTVYTHLAEIVVAEGQKVAEGETIGESGESLDGPRLHFEIWKDRDKQNPEGWLSAQ